MIPLENPMNLIDTIRYEYDSFGNMKHHGHKIKQPYAYTGREWDRETRLYYYNARYYDPQMGRFLEIDPIGFAGGDINLYAYVGNNPVNLTDPLGLYTMPGGELYTKCMENAPKNCKDEYNNCMNKCKSNSNQCSEEKWKDPLNRSCEMICTDEFIGCFTKKTVISTYCDFLYKPRIRGK